MLNISKYRYVSIKHPSFVYTRLNVKTVQFQTIQLTIIAAFSFSWLIDRTISDSASTVQRGPESDDNNMVFYILQSSRITEASPSDFLVSYLGYTLGESYLSAEMQSVYSPVPADWANLSCVIHTHNM